MYVLHNLLSLSGPHYQKIIIKIATIFNPLSYVYGLAYMLSVVFTIALESGAIQLCFS